MSGRGRSEELAPTLEALSRTPSVIVSDDIAVPTPIFASGTVLNDIYEIRSIIGAGGMGQVYEAFDRELHRTVAIKAAWPGIDRELLAREARLLSAFRTTGLVQVHAKLRDGETEYMVMELLRGTLLSEMVGTPLPLSQVQHILAGVADALAVLHEAGIAHRDLKPANVMRSGDRIVLMDLGIADLEEFTDDHFAGGTPGYVAPELILRAVRPGEAHLCDVYSLGVLAYRLITGSRPFHASTKESLLEAQLLSRAPDVRDQRPDVPREMAEFVAELMARDPLERPDSGETISRRIRRLALEPTAAASKDAIRVLIADDEPVAWEVLAYVLEERDFDLTYVEDGVAALEAMVEKPFDLVITDKNMPRMNGLVLLREIKTRFPGTDVVIMTGYASKESTIEAINLGACGLLEKPFDLDVVGEMISSIAARRRGIAETRPRHGPAPR